MRAICIVLVFLAGCSARDGDILAQVFRKAGEKIESAAGGSPNQLAGRFRANASPIGLADRVKTRLQWDRYLEGVEVEVESTPDGVVKLKGKMPDLAKKERVLDLARATTGVKEVIDELQVPKEK
jgi:osmotically-inducible protein OsmY